MYDVALWKYISISTFNKFKAAYRKCIRKMFCYARRDGMSGILLEFALPPVNTIVHTSRDLFARQCSARCHSIILFSRLQLLSYWCVVVNPGMFYTVVFILILLCFLLGFSVLCFCMFFCMLYGFYGLK